MKNLFLLFFLMSISFSCYKQEPPIYGPEYNEQRRKIGIAQLPVKWAFKGYKACNTSLYKFPIWTNEYTASRGKPGHTVKEVIYLANNQILQEKDTFESGRTFASVDGSGWEQLEIQYGYKIIQDKRNVVCPIDVKQGWTYLYTFDTWTTVKPKHITKQQADSLLMAWNARRDGFGVYIY